MKAQDINPEAKALLKRWAREVRDAGYARRLQEPAISGQPDTAVNGGKFGLWRVEYRFHEPRRVEGCEVKRWRFPLPARLANGRWFRPGDPARAELDAWIAREREFPRMTPGRAERKGWLYIGNDIWVTPWNLEAALRAAQGIQDAKWERTAETMRKWMRGRCVFEEPPALLWEHLVEQGMARPQNDMVNSLRCNLLGFFFKDGDVKEEWVERERERNQEWWLSNRKWLFPDYMDVWMRSA